MNFAKIGMRNIKTSVSVFLCILLFDVANRGSSFYACVAAVICMQQTLENTFNKGMSRVVGTVIGGVMGSILLYADEFFTFEGAYIFVLSVAIVILIQACVLLKQNDAAAICCVVFLSIALNHRGSGDYIYYTVSRVVDTSVGILIAVFVNRFLNVDKIMEKLKFKKTAEIKDADEDSEKNNEG